MTDNDSREKLEADIERYLSQAGCREMACGWLDRQAAITEKECCKPLKRRIAKLEADFEALQQVHRETLHSYLDLKERYRELKHENIRMNKVLTEIRLAFIDSVNMYVINAKLETIRHLLDDYKKGR